MSLTKQQLYDRAYYQANREKRILQMKEYNKEWRPANREQISLQHKDYYQTNREQIIEYQKEYYQANKERKNLQMKEWYQANQPKIKEYRQANREKYILQNKEYRQVLADYIDSALGVNCSVCEKQPKKIRHRHHEIHGKKHPAGISGWLYMIEHLEDFITVCQTCHQKAHKELKIND